MGLFLMLAGGALVAFTHPLAAAMGYALFWFGLWKQASGRFLTAWIWGGAVHAVQLAWLATPTYHGPMIYLAYGVICVLLGCVWACFAVWVKPGSVRPVLLAAVWTLIEWARLHFLCGFAFDFAGMSLAETVYGRQLAVFGGVLGLTFFVMLTNFVLLKGRLFVPLWACLALFPYAFGLAHVQWHKIAMDRSDVGRAVIVQTGMRLEEKVPMGLDLSAFVSPIQQWERALKQVEKADWIVFPEAAFPFGAKRPFFTHQQVEKLFGKELEEKAAWSHLDIAGELSKQTGSEVIIGLDDYDEEGSYNAVFHLDGDHVTRWEKKRLLPIAECLPFEWLRPIAKDHGIEDFFTPGVGMVVAGKRVPLSASICYDECFSSLIREERAELHVNVTNDGWYPATQLPKKHFKHGRLRAIENGIPLLRSCNTGVSAVVNSLGETVAAIEHEGADTLIVDVPLYSFFTPFARYGNAPLLLFSLASVASFLLRCSKKRRWDTFVHIG